MRTLHVARNSPMTKARAIACFIIMTRKLLTARPVQLKSKTDAKVQSFKISYHTEQCEKFKRAEYACICPPEEEQEHEHKPGEKEHKHDDRHKD